MKKIYFLAIISIIIFLCNDIASAQKTFEDISLYNNYIVEKHNNILAKYIIYIKTSVHSNSENKIERKLDDMVNEISIVIKELEKVTPMKEDSAGFLTSTIESLKIEKKLYENDFKDVDKLKEKSENSYEDMLKYFDAEEQASKKMQEASAKTEITQKKFAEDNDFELVESNSKMSEQLEQISRVNNYTRLIYLQYFRVYKPLSLFLEALNNELYSEADSLNKEIAKTCITSLDSLKNIGTFNNNSNLKTKATSLITFYQTSSQTQFVQMLEIAQKENLVQTDVDKYNKLIETFGTKQSTYSQAYFTAYDNFMKANIKE